MPFHPFPRENFAGFFCLSIPPTWQGRVLAQSVKHVNMYDTGVGRIFVTRQQALPQPDLMVIGEIIQIILKGLNRD